MCGRIVQSYSLEREGRAQSVSPVPAERNYASWRAQLHPTRAQARLLAHHRWQLQKVWNWAVGRYRWRLDNGTFSEHCLDAELAGRAEKFELSIPELIGVCWQVYSAWREFVQHRPTSANHPRKPRRRSKKNKLRSFDIISPHNVRIVGEFYLRIPDIGVIGFRGALPVNANTYRKVTLTQTVNGWFVSIMAEIPSM